MNVQGILELKQQKVLSNRKTSKGHKHTIYKIKEIQVVLRHMKRCLSTVIIRGMQVKAILKKHISPLRQQCDKILGGKLWGHKQAHTCSEK